jgi:hypothetical protein
MDGLDWQSTEYKSVSVGERQIVVLPCL